MEFEENSRVQYNAGWLRAPTHPTPARKHSLSVAFVLHVDRSWSIYEESWIISDAIVHGHGVRLEHHREKPHCPHLWYETSA